MPHTDDDEPSMPMSLMAAPQCAACGQFMRLTLIEPHEKFTNLDAHTYECVCGWKMIASVARI